VTEYATNQGRKRKRAKGNAANEPPAKKRRQARITYYFGTRDQAPPVPSGFQFLSEQKEAASKPVTVPDNIEITGEKIEFGARDTDLDCDVAELTLFKDRTDNTYWVNNIQVEEDYRWRGIAIAMLKRALRCPEDLGQWPKVKFGRLNGV
jgi:hypothetical protein